MVGETVIVYSWCALLGVCLGSYLNSWLWRAHEREAAGRSTRLPSRSVCVSCRRRLKWYENIPLVSFAALKAKCRTCREPIPTSYFISEAAVGLAFVAAAWRYLGGSAADPWRLLRDLVFTGLLAVIFFYDARYQLVLSGVVWSGTIIALVVNIFVLGEPWPALAIGAAAGGGFFLLQWLVSRGRWIGGGDVRLGVMMGALLGWPNILASLFLAYVAGALYALPAILLEKKSWRSSVPFGTLLSLAAFVTLLWGDGMVTWYRQLIGW